MCAMSKKVLVIRGETHCAISSRSHKIQCRKSFIYKGFGAFLFSLCFAEYLFDTNSDTNRYI